MCGSFHGMKGPIELVSLIDAEGVVTCSAGPQLLDAHSWVQIRHGLYSGDLAFIHCVTNMVPDVEDNQDFLFTIVTIHLIPLIPPEKKAKAQNSHCRGPLQQSPL